jgi:hypothetical protein
MILAAWCATHPGVTAVVHQADPEAYFVLVEHREDLSSTLEQWVLRRRGSQVSISEHPAGRVVVTMDSLGMALNAIAGQLPLRH